MDYLVENQVNVKLKAVEAMNKLYEVHLLTYLEAIDRMVGFLINSSVEKLKDGIKRLII